MELVNGIPITEYCDRYKLSTRRRLKLFATVCRAVQHAHQKGVIHRDLKPTNVLVTRIDGAAVPKIIDFGVAKAINQEQVERTAYTNFAQLVGTPLYMSPEQAELSGVDVDTRSDVYSLGVLLYELLAGETPFDKQTLKEAGFDEMRRIIREDEPPKPSTRISTLQAEALSTLSGQHSSDPRKFSQTLHGELDWLVMKSLEKDRDRRYESASAFADDVVRYLNDEPVEACPPSGVYRIRKFARRNRTVITTAALIAVALTTGTIVSTWQALKALDAQELADRRLTDAQTQQRGAEQSAEKARESEAFSRQLVYAADMRLAAQAWETGDVRRHTDLLDRYIGLEGKDDPRGFEWWYLRQLGTATFRTIVEGEEGYCSLRHSRDGRFLATGRADGVIDVWDGHGERHLATLRGHRDLVRGLDFAPDGSRLASIGDDGTIRLWELVDGHEIRAIQAYRGIGFDVCFGLDGTLLVSCGEEPTIGLWDPQTGESVGQLASEWDVGRTLAVSKDGRLCAGSSSGFTFVWDLETRTKIKGRIAERIRCLRFATGGTLVGEATEDHRIRLRNVRTGDIIATFDGHEDDVQDLAFHPSGTMLASCDKGGVIRTWSLEETGEPDETSESARWPSSFRGHASRAWSLEFSPDGEWLVSAGKDGTVRAWKGRSQPQRELSVADAIASAFSPSGDALIIAGRKAIHIWDR